MLLVGCRFVPHGVLLVFQGGGSTFTVGWANLMGLLGYLLSHGGAMQIPKQDLDDVQLAHDAISRFDKLLE